MNVAGQVNIGNGVDSSINAVANGTLNMSGGLFNQTNANQSITVGSGGGLGALNLSSGTINVSGDANFGNGGTGASAASSGTLNMSGGVLNVAGNLRFGAALGWFNGQHASGTGVMNLTGGTINANYVGIANNPQWDGDQSSGTSTLGTGAVLNSKTWVNVGAMGNGSAQLTINGAVNVNTANAGGGLSVADGENVQGTVTINPGAKVGIENNGQIAYSTNTTYASQTGVINQIGGSVDFYSDSGATVGGTGFLNMESQSTGGSFTYNLNGGTLQVPKIAYSNGGWGSANFSFNGGTLKATGNQSSFLDLGNQYWTHVNVQSGGAIIDDSGYSIGIAQNLGDGGGGGGLTKLGSGVLTLTGNNGYTGGTTINGGTLNINADAALGAAPARPPRTSRSRTTARCNSARTIFRSTPTGPSFSTATRSRWTPLATRRRRSPGRLLNGTGSGSIATASNGIVTLSGSSNYTGATTVNIGTLNLVSGTLGATAVSIGPNGALAASGTAGIGGNVATTGAGAAINMQGGGTGVLSIAGNLNLAASSVLGFQLGSSAGATDLIAVAGSLSAAAGHEVVNLATPSLVSGSYTLLTAAAGGLTAGGTDFTLGSLPSARRVRLEQLDHRRTRPVRDGQPHSRDGVLVGSNRRQLQLERGQRRPHKLGHRYFGRDGHRADSRSNYQRLLYGQQCGSEFGKQLDHGAGPQLFDQQPDVCCIRRQQRNYFRGRQPQRT